MSHEKQTAWIQFFGKLITPLTIIILVLSFKSTVQERLSQASEVSVLGNSFKFDTQSFHGQLSALELYYLIQAKVEENTYLDRSGLTEKSLAAIYLLQSKEVITIDLIDLQNVEGDFIELKLTSSGKELSEKLGLG